MGLDLVEMVYRIEEEFEITIPDEVSVTFVTPKTVINYLMSRPEVSGKWSRDYITIWLIIEDEAIIDRKDYNEDSRFIENMGMD